MAKKFFDISPLEQSGKLKVEKKVLIYREKKGKLPHLVIGLILVILIMGLIFFSFYFSKAEVEIWPETKDISFKTEIKIDEKTEEIGPDLWFKQKSIPGQFLEKEKEFSREFPSSGVIEKKGFAQGKIRVHNNSRKPITLIRDTRFLSDKGKQFHSLKRITIPARSYLDGVEVKAAAPGKEYNIGPSKFSVPGLAGTPLYILIYAESFEPMKGGFLEKAPQVTQDDLKQAEQILLEESFRQGKESLKKAVAEDYILLDDLLEQEVIEKFPLAKVGQELSTFVFKAKIKSTGFIFKKADLESFAREFIYSQIEPNKKLVEKSLNLNYLVEERDLGQGRVILSLEISAEVYSELNLYVLKEKIRGKSAVEGEYFLEKTPEILKAKIIISPFWVKNVSQNERRIEMDLKFD